jgi:hypothetical protein
MAKSVHLLYNSRNTPEGEARIKSLSDFAISIMIQGKEKDDENSELFKESFDAELHHYAAKSDSSI